MPDRFVSFADSPSSPARRAFAIVPSDAAPLPATLKALYVGTGGHVTLRPIDADADVTFRNLSPGQVLDVRVQYVRATGTTAADLVGLA